MLVARREETDWVHSEVVYEIVPKEQCKDAGTKPLDLISVDTDKSVDPIRKKIRSRLQENTKRRSKVRLNELSIVLCSTTSRSCEGACLNHDVGEFVEQRETIEVETQRHQQSTFPRNSPETHLHQTSRRGSSEVWRRQSWQIDQEHVWNSRRFPHLATRLCESDLWRVRRLPKRRTQCSVVPQSESRCENGSARRRLRVVVR